MFIFILLLTAFPNNVFGQIEVPIVRTSYGEVQGVYEESEYGQFFLYMGIPYGQPPKDNFFGDPVDPDPWDGVFQAVSDDSVCPQREELNLTLVGNPNCLDLNVYVPANRTSTEPLSVLYWIYGGGFTIGYNSRYMWGPEFLIRHEIIMVAVNYRLGPYGFMCLNTPQVPGNAGLKDILKGLKWVRDNIAAFGGNPDSITAGGSSSGGIAIEYILCSPSNTGLFQRAIFQSGTAHTYSDIMNITSRKEVLQLSEYLGYKGGSLSGSVQFLQNVHHYDILLAVEALGLTFSRCVEPEIAGVEPFFIKGHMETFASGSYPSIDVLLGFNIEELPFNGDINESQVDDLVNTALSLQLTFKNEETKIEVGNILRKFYYGTQPIGEDIRQALAYINADYYLTYPISRQLDYFQRKNLTLYYYEFGYDGGRNFNKYKGNITWNGAIHADEIGYIFNQGLYSVEPDESDALIIDRTTAMWTNFVKFGNPTPEVNELLPVRWLPVENGVKNYLKINTEMATAVDPNFERMAFWDLLMESYYEMWTSENS